MTEAEAKTKWCPMMVHVITARCIGSTCAMWRWHERPDFVFGKSSIDMSDPDKLVSVEEKVRNTAAPTGYCGLAGKP